MEPFVQTSDTDLINGLPHFKCYEPEARQYISEHWHRITGKRAGSTIIDFDDPPDRGVIVVSGVVELVSKMRETAIWNYGAGSVLDDAVVTGTPSPYALIARTPCHLIFLGDWYRSLARKFPVIQSNVYHQAQLRRSAIEQCQERLIGASKPGRVALALLNIANAVAQPAVVADDACRFPFTVSWWETQEQIGDSCFVCRSKVRQALARIHRTGAIGFSGWYPEQLTMPLELRENCIEKIEQLLRTM